MPFRKEARRGAVCSGALCCASRVLSSRNKAAVMSAVVPMATVPAVGAYGASYVPTVAGASAAGGKRTERTAVGQAAGMAA